jgi:thiol-disulfide isomerase/thioredoxin
MDFRGGAGALLSLSLALAGCGAGAASAPPPKPAVIPATDVRAMDRTPTPIASTIRGRPALVTLWATWCEPCRDEIPELGKLDAYARAKGAVVVGVAVGEPIDHVAEFAHGRPMPYLVLVDEEFRFADAVGERAVPATLVVDRDGTIVYRGGALDARSIEAFRRLVEGHSVAGGSSPRTTQ